MLLATGQLVQNALRLPRNLVVARFLGDLQLMTQGLLGRLEVVQLEVGVADETERAAQADPGAGKSQLDITFLPCALFHSMSFFF